ncbi:MAG: nucleotidyl transferase AbiEii/AbiGii toxin family protein [Thermoanaerobaculia bacterium]
MKTRSTYSPEVTRRARRVLADVFAALGSRADYAVLVGGGAPGLLPQTALEDAPGHAGTTDADILLDPSGFTADDYETLAERLLDRGYRYRKDRDGNDLKFSFEVEVEGQSVVVDFLSPAQPNSRGFRVPIQPGLHAHATSAAHVPWLFIVEVTVEEELLQGGRFAARVRVVDVPGIVVLKALTFRERQAPKDAYDLWYVLTYARGGPEAVAQRLSPYAADSDVSRAVQFLRDVFASPESAGPVAVAVFEELQGEEADRLAAQAYAVVQGFLRRWDEIIASSKSEPF